MTPIGLPLVEWTAAVLYGGALAFSFCWVFARAQLLSATKAWVSAGVTAQDAVPPLIIKEEARKLLLLNGAAVVLAVVYWIWHLPGCNS